MTERRAFIGGSDGRIILGTDEAGCPTSAAWREKRGEDWPRRPRKTFAVQLGLATEELNRRWFQANTCQILTDVQQRFFRPGLKWMAATLDGRVENYAGCGLCLAQTLEAVCSTALPILGCVWYFGKLAMPERDSSN